MAKVTTSVNNWSAGEFSPRLFGRFDINKYSNAAKIIENFILLKAGGAKRRSGTKFVGHVKDSSLKTRLINFEFSTTQAYTIELGNLYARFYANQGRVVEGDKTITGVSQADPGIVTLAGHGYSDGDWVVITDVVGMTELNDKTFIVANSGVTFTLQDVDGTDIDTTGYTAYVSGGVCNKVVEISTPYTTAQLFDVQFAQSADVMYIAHQSHAPRKLQRTSATVFTLTTISFFKADTGVGITLTAAGAGNTPFLATHIGSIWRVKSGYVLITAYTSSTVVTGTVQTKLDGSAGDLDTGPAATEDWAEGAWSAVRGYPGSVSLFEQRLVFGGSMNNPQTFWASVSEDFENMAAGANDSDAYLYTIANEQVNEIRWLSTGPKSLQMGTAGGSHSASSGTDNSPITPTTIQVQRDTTYGAKRLIPKRIGNFVYYIQRNGSTLRELGFDFDVDSNVALDMTILSDHITKDSINDMAYQQSPNNMLWCARDDGQIATLTRQIDQEIIAWARHIIGGSFTGTSVGTAIVDSVASIPVEGGDDEVWVIVKRTINSITRRYVEYLVGLDFDEHDDSFYVDSGLTLDDPKTITAATKADPVVITSNGHGFSDGDQIKIDNVIGMTELNDKFFLVANKAANTFELTDTAGDDIDGTAYTTYVSSGEAREMVTSISGLDHLEGETVQVLADGAVRPDNTVSSGAITLASKAAKVHVGYQFISKIKGLSLTDGSATGTGFGKERRIYQATIQFFETLGAQFGREGDLETLLFRKPSDSLDQPPPIFTGVKRIKFPSGTDRAGEYLLQQIQPLPMTVTAIVLQSQVEDK